MVSLAIWILSALFVLWITVQILTLMVWGVVATFVGICDKISNWDRSTIEQRIERERKSLGYS